LDFDTSCEGFPMYDPTLICNKTHYFNFDEYGYEKSKKILSRFLPEYLKYNTLSQPEINAFYDLIALYHFALQATVIENFGLDCVDNAFLDKQLDWLYRWREQCERAR
jgi:Ser/Thr protein kinase RdoA (MazF antagonist)